LVKEIVKDYHSLIICANFKASSFSAPRYLELTALTTALIDVVEQSHDDTAIL
jgi:hypothetical protein